MDEYTKSVLVVGFNTRPLAYSLKKAGYDVYAVDFFGDLDLYPNVKDSLIIINELDTSYDISRGIYSKFLMEFAIKMMRKHSNIKYLIIASGLDDAFEERENILNNINEKRLKIENINNDIEIIKKVRNIEFIYNFLDSQSYKVPLTIPYEKYKEESNRFQFPVILKKKQSSGGINVFKIENEEKLYLFLENQRKKNFFPSDWLIQEYIVGTPVSCTIISNGNECEIISINRQIIGEKQVNAPKEFIYCGNIVPAGLSEEENEIISKISKTLANKFHLKGINGFDFVLRNHYPYLMEINPRIPGSIRVSECVLNLNLLDLHIKSFNPDNWVYVMQSIKSARLNGFATKLIIYAPKEIDKNHIERINNLQYIHDKSEPSKNVLKSEPLCTILFKNSKFSESYKGALKIVEKINNIIDD